eukprot:1431303-Ditylum_brightwellii.AAC.1
MDDGRSHWESRSAFRGEENGVQHQRKNISHNIPAINNSTDKGEAFGAKLVNPGFVNECIMDPVLSPSDTEKLLECMIDVLALPEVTNKELDSTFRLADTISA